MSTISNLLSDGKIKAVTLGLVDDELADRGLFGTTRLHSFLENDLPAIQSRDAVLSAEEQLANLLGRYLTNRPLVLLSPLSPIRHLANGIWELKTLDLRVFGWFVERDSMIIDSGCDVKLLKSGKLNYSGFIAQTEYVRKTLGFSPTNCVQGNQPHDILKNFTVLPKSKRS